MRLCMESPHSRSWHTCKAGPRLLQKPSTGMICSCTAVQKPAGYKAFICFFPSQFKLKTKEQRMIFHKNFSFPTPKYEQDVESTGTHIINWGHVGILSRPEPGWALLPAIPTRDPLSVWVPKTPFCTPDSPEVLNPAAHRENTPPKHTHHRVWKHPQKVENTPRPG